MRRIITIAAIVIILGLFAWGAYDTLSSPDSGYGRCTEEGCTPEYP